MNLVSNYVQLVKLTWYSDEFCCGVIEDLSPDVLHYLSSDRRELLKGRQVLFDPKERRVGWARGQLPNTHFLQWSDIVALI